MCLIEQFGIFASRVSQGKIARRSVALSLLCSLALLAGDPDFSGTWHLDEARSDVRALRDLPQQILEIKQQGSTIEWRAKRKDQAPEETCSFAIDGKEHQSKGSTALRKTIAKWEGSALLVNTIVIAGNAQHTEMDRWKLSRDGQTLTVRRQLISSRGQMEGSLVYVKK